MKKLLILILLLLNGCVLFRPQTKYQKEIEKSGKNCWYGLACGPVAISETMCYIGYTGLPIDSSSVANEMQKKDSFGRISRFSLSLFHYEGGDVTWPYEIENYFKSKNIKTTTFYGNNEEILRILNWSNSHNIHSIVLSKQNNKLFQYHYEHFPSFRLRPDKNYKSCMIILIFPKI